MSIDEQGVLEIKGKRRKMLDKDLGTRFNSFGSGFEVGQ